MPKRSPPSQFADLQQLMMRAVMRPLTGSEEMQRKWSDGSPSAAIVESFIRPSDRLSSFERLQIYNQQYWWRLQGAFAEDFRGLRAVLGERRFEKLSTAYLDHCGSMSWTMRDLGSRLEKFLREHPELAGAHQALALDMVRVEWARVVAFDGEEKAPVDPAKLGRLPPSMIRLGLQPYFSLLELHHPIDDVLRRLKKRNIETASASNAVSSGRSRSQRRLTTRKSAETIHLAVHRVKFSVYYKRLEVPAFRVLGALRDGMSLEDACAEGFADSEEAPETNAAKLQQWFGDWVRFGWFVKP